MKISVLQHKAVFGYDQLTETPPIEWLKDQAERNVQHALDMLEEAGRRGSDLAVTTEAVNMSLYWADMRVPYPEIYEGLDGNTVRRFAEMAKKWHMFVTAGLYLTIEGKTYNCAVLFDRDGKIAALHKKIHLPAGEEYQVTHGDKLEVFDTELGRIGMLVCWDLQFPEAARILALKGADLIICPTLGWENIYGLSRAYENSVYIAAAMGFGPGGLDKCCDPACIVDNMGRILAAAQSGDSEVVTCEVDIAQEPAPQYGSECFGGYSSMRKTRFSQRHPDLYAFLSEPNEKTPLYARYFEK